MIRHGRIKLGVYLDLDTMPGSFHTPEQAHEAVFGLLNRMIPHYNPEVTLESAIESNHHGDWAVCITKENRFAIDLQTSEHLEIGWYIVKSSNPNHRDLIIPARQFHKCYRFIEDEDLHDFRAIEEIN